MRDLLVSLAFNEYVDTVESGFDSRDFITLFAQHVVHDLFQNRANILLRKMKNRIPASADIELKSLIVERSCLNTFLNRTRDHSPYTVKCLLDDFHTVSSYVIHYLHQQRTDKVQFLCLLR